MTEAAAISSYTNRLYRLFVAEFAAAMREEANAQMRKRLLGIVKGTQFGSPTSMTKFRDSLASALKDYPEDLRAVRVIVAREYAQSSGDVAASIAHAIDTTVFGFDFSTLRELRAKPHAEIAAAVRKIMTPRIETQTPSAVAAPDNIFTACSVDSSVSRPQCLGGKLIVPSNRLESLVDILASDISDRRKLISLTLAAGVFDEHDLVERPGETLRIIESPFQL